jgi:predicted helicase
MSYIYAVLCAPVYREAHAEFLRIDFPRIPFPESRADFEKLSKLGWDLIQKHLLREVPELGLGRYQGKGDHMVERQRYVLVEEAVYINKAQFFAPVPPEVWDFHIGGYRVIDTYLRYRKGRTLSLDEVANVEKVFNVLAYTITAMQRIDEAYARAFAAEVA